MEKTEANYLLSLEEVRSSVIGASITRMIEPKMYKDEYSSLWVVEFSSKEERDELYNNIRMISSAFYRNDKEAGKFYVKAHKSVIDKIMAKG